MLVCMHHTHTTYKQQYDNKMMANSMICYIILLCYAISAAGFLHPVSLVSRRSHNNLYRQALSSIMLSNKSSDEEHFIKQSLQSNSLFADIPKDIFQQMVASFQLQTANQGDVIVQQGDRSEDVYLVADGSCRILVDNTTVPEPYGIIGQGIMFGELGVLYNETRAATILVESKTLTYYQIAGEVFTSTMSQSSNNNPNKEIDDVINTISGTQALYDGKVLPDYRPERTWLWTRFAGTVLEISLESTLLSMLGCVVFIVYAKLATYQSIYTLELLPPDKDLPFIQNLSEIKVIWELQKTLTTFVLTFFVNRCFNFWDSVYKSAREVQGKISGFNLLLATNVVRNQDGTLTTESEQFLEEVGQCTRLFHILFWASKTKRFSALMSDEGLKRMESRGLMSSNQLKILLDLDIPNDQLHSTPLTWMMIRTNKAMDEGVLLADNATKGALLREFMFLRNAYTTIGNLIEGRMPLAYVQFVQILVDSFVVVSPLALYPSLGDYSVVGVGLITLFFTGINSLAKIFLDPLNSEAIYENSIYFDLGVMIREANGDSTKWRKAGKISPF